MSLAYGIDQILSVQIQTGRNGGVNVANFNAVVEKLVENDRHLMPDTQSGPRVFERAWFNDPSVPGYDPGDAVWLNTEDPTDFVNAKTGDIRRYIGGNARLKNLYRSISGDASREHEFIRQVALSGYSDGTGWLEPIYSIGDLLKPAQIMQSLCADNKTDPADPAMSAFWEPFFRSNDEQAISADVMDYLSALFEDAYGRHVAAYHLVTDGHQANAADVSAAYLSRRLDNIPSSAMQNYVSHQYRSGDDLQKLQGFDSVKLFIRRSYGDGLCKWFRLWSSGYLEHGGVVDANSPSLTEDQHEYGGSCVKVNLAWSYANQIAPCYDFPQTGLEPFYKQDGDIDLAGRKLPYQASGNVYLSSRYTVKVSDIRGGGYPQSLDSSRFGLHGCYLANEVNTINNDSFCALRNTGTSRISYYCSGFTYTNSPRR